MAVGLPVFGFFSRPDNVVFPAHCDVLALQVGVTRAPPADRTVLSSGIPAITVEREWPFTITPIWDATLTVPLDYNSAGANADQAANELVYGPGSKTTAMYGRDFLIGSAVQEDYMWTQGPGCQSGLSGTDYTYKVRGYLFFNLTLIKKAYDVLDLGFAVNFSGGSGSIYQVWGEVLLHCKSVNYASLKTLGGTTMTKAASMGWNYKSMAYHAKGIGQPTITTGETDTLTPQIKLTVDMLASDYSMTFSSSGFGGSANNVFSSTQGAGSD